MNAWYFAYGSNLLIEQMVERTGPIGQGDDIDVREAQLFDVFDQQGRQLAVAERTLPVLRFPPPRSDVHLINAYRR